MPAGFCSPLRCHSGIMAKSTMHQANAMPTQIFSDRWAGFHQIPGGDSMPVFIWGAPSGKWGRSQGEDFPEPPRGVEDDHDQNSHDEQQERPVVQPLPQWGFGLFTGGM